jgi:hypothetical protein
MLPNRPFQNLPRKETSKNERVVSDPDARFCDSAGPDFGGPLLVPSQNPLATPEQQQLCLLASHQILLPRKFVRSKNGFVQSCVYQRQLALRCRVPKFVHNDHIRRKRSFISSIDTAMTLSSESIIGLVTLVIACPPTAWSLIMLYRHLRRSRTECKYRSR